MNGHRQDVMVEPNRLLVDVLREDLDLTGAKKACDGGECGSCTVMLGGKAVMSCLLPVGRVGAKEIVTVEGLAACDLHVQRRSPDFHPLQQSFIDLGAAQCGFCIPGMIMEAEALIKAKPNPSRADVVSRLSRNTCRCTGYSKIIDAVLDAAAVMRNDASTARPQDGDSVRVGARIGKPDGRNHVRGSSRYAADLKREGMLYAKILRSPHHHARILGIDASEAMAMEGVKAVITCDDIPGRQTLTNSRPQMYLLAKDAVRFLGEAVVAVAAESEEIAAEAIRHIKVAYDVLAPVFDPVEAMNDDAPLLHPPLPNWVESEHVVLGDVDQAFAESDVIVEGTYTTQAREHCAMEPEAALAYFDVDGRLVFHSPHHHPFTGRLWLADMLALDPDRVRVIVPPMGGNFGMRGEFVHAGVAGLLAVKTGRPVKIVYSREESMLGSGKSESFNLTYKTGASKDGKLTAFKAQVIANGGSWIPRPGAKREFSRISHLAWVSGPYDIPVADVVMYQVCTNRPRSSPLRGTQMPDFAFAFESQMDMLASRLGMDPLDFRIKNAIELNDTVVDGRVMDECVGAKATMEALREPYAKALAASRSEPLAGHWRRGVGLACIWKPFGGARLEGDSGTGGDWLGYPLGECSAGIELTADGHVRVLTGAVEKGQGITIVLAQIAAEALDLPLSAVLPTFGGDTLLAPYPQATNGQRTTFTVGGAVVAAARIMKQGLIAVAADMLSSRPDEVSFSKGCATVDGHPGKRLGLVELARGLEERHLPLKYESTYRFEKSEKGQGPIMSYAAMLLEIDVNVENGRIKVGRVTYVADPGRVINPLLFEGQVDGGVVMGLGYALGEQFVPGETMNFNDYGLPMIKDAPESINLLIVEDPVYGSPYGAKGAGETPSVPGMAAVANAIAHATGGRIFEMPARPQKVVEAIALALR